MTPEEYTLILSRCGTFEELPDKERWSLMQAWRRAYAGSLHARTGKWVRGGLDWHVFSYRDAPAANGAHALEAYRAEHPEEVLIIPHSERLPAARLRPHVPPEFSGSDVYVFPVDLAWTMAFTHEESAGSGPYFSRRQELEMTSP